MPTPDGFPVAVKAARATMGGLPTDFLSSTYADAVLLIITQLGTVGTVLHVRRDATFDGQSTYSTSVLMGKRDEPLLQLAARQLAELAALGGDRGSGGGGGGGGGGAPGEAGSRPLVLCLALVEHTQEVVRELLAVITEQQLL